MKIQETRAHSIVCASKLPATDFVVNPFTGSPLFLRQFPSYLNH
jgi:hypothetical protein